MSRWYIYLIPTFFGVVLLASLGSCRKDFEYNASTGNLEFSKDTVFLDTIFTTIGSSTYTLKVYNRSNNDLYIPSIGLENGQESGYRLNVDGLAGKEFVDVPLLAKDSLFVFIETTFNLGQTSENEFLYTDAIVFGSGSNTQKVQLVTLVKDAVFLYPRKFSDGTNETLVLGSDENGDEIRVDGFFLDSDELLFTNEKPYVIYGYAAIPENNTLTIEAGARVHFHNDSGLLVENEASLLINGLLSEDQELLENEIIFEGDRLESSYAQQPGQWGTVWLRAGSINNEINYLTIKNATVGLRIEGDEILEAPTLTLKNSQIYNSSNINIWATTANLMAENVVVGNAKDYSFYGELGGKYSFIHCTMANYWRNGPRSGATLRLDNGIEFPTGETGTENLENADFANCIIAGNLPIELELVQDTQAEFNFKFKNCILQYQDSNDGNENNPLFDFENIDLYENIILNEEPDFLNPTENQFQIGRNSSAINKADINFSTQVPMDILGTERTQNPDIGAYQYVSEN
ncbi:hypothetical protein HME9304_03373 [Flagellimonas maritima]|uniref:Right-handed parallel beta-helix repeat-containing protein n=1 Tax=Flagellimonas maritima TaxID=1383885 RepID=A0A2Z4LX88_9FLAO|nr:hypothetical protein [Allomuricauda aurantiaca]AWX46340.1 hypothetical protein HME9304_03373 [Allomuricauda aurantiaca]